MKSVINNIPERDTLLKVKNLRTTFYSKGCKIEAVRGTNLVVERGEILGVVGESGSGKSVMMKSILGIIPRSAKIDEGEIAFLMEDESISLQTRKEEDQRKRDRNDLSGSHDCLEPIKKDRTTYYGGSDST